MQCTSENVLVLVETLRLQSPLSQQEWPVTHANLTTLPKQNEN